MEWARTLRIDAPRNDEVQGLIAAAFSRAGLAARFGPASELSRTYVLLEGTRDTDPAQYEQAVPDALWYDEAIIAIAIEPAPADALPELHAALGGAGAPAGVAACDIIGGRLVVEVRPSVTQPMLLLQIVDLELRRRHGYRRTQLLAPLPMELMARIAALGLQAPEIAPDRILESLLHVE